MHIAYTDREARQAHAARIRAEIARFDAEEVTRVTCFVRGVLLGAVCGALYGAVAGVAWLLVQ